MVFFAMASRLPYLFVLLLSTTLAAQPHDLNLRTERGNTSHDGRVKLIWASTGKEATYTLQLARQENFANPKELYSGPDRASFISGLKNGTYYFRVKSAGADWSKTLVVEVEHHSLRLAVILFVVGGTVFLLTVAVVVEGIFRTKKTAS